MKFLLDVNALVALGFLQHEFHPRASKWIIALLAKGTAQLATCSITELGFVRVLAQAPLYGFSISQARTLLLRMKTSDILKFTFVHDNHDISHLPGWVKTARQTTDGHLVQLAKANGAVLATLDKGIRGAFVIPSND